MGDSIKHQEYFDIKKIEAINTVSFIMGLSASLLTYIISSYLKDSIKSVTDNIGAFYLVSYLIALIALLNFHKVVRRYGKSRVFTITLFAKVVVLFLLSIIPTSLWGPILLIFYVILGTVEAVCIDVILESFSIDKKSGRIRGLHLMILNIGYVFGPMISTQLIKSFNYQVVFFVASVADILILSIAAFFLRNAGNEFNNRVRVMDVVKKAFRHKNILRVYSISLMLEIFYALMVVYSPIYLRELGMDWLHIGYAFSIMLLPFVVLPYMVGYIADKKLGEKEMIIAAIIVMAISTMSVFMADSRSFVMWAVILFFTRIGASTIDTLRDSYFYKRIDGTDVDLIDLFRTASPMSYIISSILAIIILFFLPTKYIFLFLSIIIIASLYPAIRLVDNKCEDEINAENCAVK